MPSPKKGTPSPGTGGKPRGPCGSRVQACKWAMHLIDSEDNHAVALDDSVDTMLIIISWKSLIILTKMAIS